MLLTLINVITFLVFHIFSVYALLGEEALDKSKVGTELITEETEIVVKTNKNASFTIDHNGKKEYLSVVPLYNVTMVGGVDGEASATAKIDVPGLVAVNMNTDLIISR